MTKQGSLFSVIFLSAMEFVYNSAIECIEQQKISYISIQDNWLIHLMVECIYYVK